MTLSIHCDTEAQARSLRAALAERLGSFGLELHPEKTKIVYCKDTNRRGRLRAHQLRLPRLHLPGRGARPRSKRLFIGFNPAMSANAKKAIGKKIRDWHLNRRSGTDLSGLAEEINPQVRGWIGYYGAFYRSKLIVIARRIDQHLVRWAMQKFKRLRGRTHTGLGMAGLLFVSTSPRSSPTGTSSPARQSRPVGAR